MKLQLYRHIAVLILTHAYGNLALSGVQKCETERIEKKADMFLDTTCAELKSLSNFVSGTYPS